MADRAEVDLRGPTERTRLEAPPPRFPLTVVASQRPPRRDIEEGRGGAEQMTRILRLPASVLREDVQPAIVGVADLWHQTIGTENGCQVPAHPVEALTEVI